MHRIAQVMAWVVVGTALGGVILVQAPALVHASARHASKTPSDISDLKAQLAELRAEVATLKDRQQIHDLYIHYGRGIDRLDESLYRSAFWPDAQINYGTAESITPDEHWTNHMIKGAKGNSASWGHLLTNEAVDINGDVAHVEIYVTPMLVPKDKERAKNWVLLSGRYIDRLERRHGEWRIAVREFLPHFAMKIDTSNWDDAWNGFFKNAQSGCIREPQPLAPYDPPYVRPLPRRTMQAGRTCAK